MSLYLMICEFYLSMFFVFAKHEQYDGHSLYQVNVDNAKQIEIINNLVNKLYLDVWSRAVPGKPGHILVPKDGKEIFQISLNAGGINYNIEVDNIIELLKLEDQQLKAAAIRNQRHKSHRGGVELSYDTVYKYDEIIAYLQYLAKVYDKYVTLDDAGGKSFQGRPIYYLKISTTKFEDNNKPIVMLQSLLHSREWITSPVTLYAIQKLVVARSEPDLLKEIDWIIIPVSNPDGYVYTHETDRLWRKNRRTGLSARNVCIGVDLNRNFNVRWGIHSSGDACSDDFHGKSPLSEPETQAIADIITTYKERIALFLDFHSYGSKILYPYGDGRLPKNYYNLNNGGVVMAQAIDKVSLNHSYAVGNIKTLLYAISGCAIDLAQDEDIPLPYMYELPAFNNGSKNANGYFVDSDSIAQTSFETWKGIVVGAKYILNKTNLW